MNLTTSAYSKLLGYSLKHTNLVLVLGVFIALATGLFLGIGILGQELVPSEDQSRLLVHVVCPVGASIDEIGNLLGRCETILSDRDEVAGIMTAVATESGLLMNEADIFVQLVPRSDRLLTQQQLGPLIRKELMQVEDVRVVVRDQSTEGFTLSIVRRRGR